MSRVVLAMSGGVDSSVAAHLLLEQGHEVVGVFMRHGETAIAACSVDGTQEMSPLLPLYQTRSDHKQGCCSASDAEDARRVADRLELPFYALNLQAEFRQIVDYFVDDGKDQSYVLFGIERSLLPRMMLPVGGYRKAEIRELAGKLGLRVAGKRDSQEICFVAGGKHAEFVQARRGPIDTSGEIVATDGRVVGRHQGIERFTIGQRRGLGVAMGERAFVVRIESDSRRVVIGGRHELARNDLFAGRCNWLVDEPDGPFRCLAKIRYNSAAFPATAETLAGDRLRVHFDQPRSAVAPGQAVVCYDGDRVLGGGWIE